MNPAQHENQTLETKVLEAIRCGDVRMKPRWFFALRAVLLGTGITILLFATLFIGSFIVFSLRQSGLWFTPSYGLRGTYLFLRAVPWVLVALSMLFAVVLELMVRHYSFAYRAPLAYSLLGVMGLVGFGAVIVAQTPLHGRIFIYARGHRAMPFAGSLYRTYLVRQDKVYHGKVISSGQGVFIIKTFPEGASFTVAPDKDDADRDFTGTQVIIFGNEQGGVVRAEEIHPAPDVEMFDVGSTDDSSIPADSVEFVPINAPTYVQ